MTTRINLSEATREELVMVVRQLNARLAESKNATAASNPELAQLRLTKRELDDRVSFLTDQAALLKSELAEARAESRALQQRVGALTQKAATDEETINDLIAQLEGKGGAAAVAAAATAAASAEQAAMQARLDEAAAQIAQLQSKVRELTETNEFYSAVVQAHDKEERARAQSPPPPPAQPAPHPQPESSPAAGGDAAVEELRAALRQARRDDEAKRRTIDALRAEVTRLELEAAVVERWRAEDDAAPSPSQRAAQPDGMSSRHSVASSSDAAAAAAASAAVPTPSPPPLLRTQAATLVHVGKSGPSLTPSTARRAAALNVDALPPIQLRGGATPREKKLLERVQLLEEHVRGVEAFEELRQRNQDEVERNRAEMFAAMNRQLEQLRKENAALLRQQPAASEVVVRESVTHAAEEESHLRAEVERLSAEAAAREERFAAATAVVREMKRRGEEAHANAAASAVRAEQAEALAALFAAAHDEALAALLRVCHESAVLPPAGDDDEEADFAVVQRAMARPAAPAAAAAAAAAPAVFDLFAGFESSPPREASVARASSSVVDFDPFA